MAQNVTIAGAAYSAVPAVDIPKTGGGTARFMDTSDANAIAGDITQGKTAYVGGVKITGTNTGGVSPTGNIALTATETAQTGIDVAEYATASVAAIPSDYVGSGVTRQTALTASGKTVTAPAGYYANSVSRSIADGSVTVSTEKVKIFSDITVFPEAIVTEGYVNDGTVLGRAVNIYMQEKTVRKNGIVTPDSGYDGLASVDVQVPTPAFILQEKSVTPTETAQSVTPDNPYAGLSKVNVGAISSEYVGSGVPRRTSSDLTASGDTVAAPSGYYANGVSKAVQSGTEGTPVVSKGAVSNHSIAVTPSVTNTEGYISGSTKTGTPVTVNASELVSGNKAITASTSTQTGIDVTNFETVSVAPTPTETKTVTENGTYTPPSGKFFSSVTVAIPYYEGW